MTELGFARLLYRSIAGMIFLAAIGCGDGEKQDAMSIAGASGAPATAGTTASPAGTSGSSGVAGTPTSSAGSSSAAGGTGAAGMATAGMAATAGMSATAGMPGTTGMPATAGMGGAMAMAGASGMAAAGTGGMPPASGAILPPVPTTDGDGPFDASVDQKAGANSWVFYPTELGKDGLKHPLFVWGTGATSVPMQYMDHFTRMASHGFIIISPNTGSVNAGALKASLDWILEQNDMMMSKFYQKIDPARIAMGGHSLGSVSTFNQEAMESRLVTTIHIAGGSMDGRGSSKVKTPTAYICGETDFALSNCQRDFMMVEDQPTFFSELKGIDHVQCARAALPGMIAWLRWHIAGETERKAQFTGPDGEFFKGIWKSQTKNW